MMHGNHLSNLATTLTTLVLILTFLKNSWKLTKQRLITATLWFSKYQLRDPKKLDLILFKYDA